MVGRFQLHEELQHLVVNLLGPGVGAVHLVDDHEDLRRLGTRDTQNVTHDEDEPLLASVAAKQKAPEDRTPEEQALLDSAIPYNPDAWDGYGFAREDLLTHAASVNSRLVALAGDTHNAWAAQLTNSAGEPVGVEFATASVSSPGLEVALGCARRRVVVKRPRRAGWLNERKPNSSIESKKTRYDLYVTL